MNDEGLVEVVRHLPSIWDVSHESESAISIFEVKQCNASRWILGLLEATCCNVAM